jgi:hypothetical protein
VCCRGRDRAVCLYFEASGVIPNLSSISRGLLPQAQLSVCLFVCLGKDLLPIGQSFFFPVRTLLQTIKQRVSLLWRVLPHVSAFLALWSASISRERRRKMHMLARYQDRSSLSWLAGKVATGTSDGSTRRSTIGPIAGVWPRELWACMQHSLTWREHTRAISIGIQSAYRRGLRSCRDITT